jgi:hypothetical protein
MHEPIAVLIREPPAWAGTGIPVDGTLFNDVVFARKQVALNVTAEKLHRIDTNDTQLVGGRGGS